MACEVYVFNIRIFTFAKLVFLDIILAADLLNAETVHGLAQFRLQGFLRGKSTPPFTNFSPTVDGLSCLSCDVSCRVVIM